VATQWKRNVLGLPDFINKPGKQDPQPNFSSDLIIAELNMSWVMLFFFLIANGAQSKGWNNGI